MMCRAARRLPNFALIVAAICLASRAVAHEPDAEAVETVKVSGARGAPSPRSASEVTQDRAVLSSAPHRTGGELLRTLPGMALTQHSGEGKGHQIFFRGFDAVHGQDLEIWVGGVPVNDVSNIHGQGYADLNFLPTEVVSRLRLSPGTYDPRQGDFAVAGSVWMDLGYDEAGITTKAAYGQFGTQRYFLAYHPESSSKATFAASEFYSTNGFGPSRAAQRASLVAQHESKLGDYTLRLFGSAYAGQFDSAGVLRLDDIERGRIDRLGTYDPHQGGNAGRSQLALELRRVTEDSRWSMAPYVVLRSMRLRQNFTGYLLGSTMGNAEDAEQAELASAQGNSEQQTNDALTVGITSSYHRHCRLLSPEDSVEVGVSARADEITQSQRKLSVETSQVTLNEVDAKIRATDVAGYVDVALHPLPRVTLRGGLRLDGLSYASEDNALSSKGERRAAAGTHLGKKATADVRLAGGLRALASYGEGFRSPQARSLQDGETVPFTTVRSFELGLRYQTSTLRTTAAMFRTQLADDLAFNPTIARNERTPATARSGLTIEMAAQPVHAFSAAASVTYARAEFTDSDAFYRSGSLMPYAPQLVARMDAAWSPSLGHLGSRPLSARLGVGGTGIARRPMPHGEFGHDFFVLDALASVRTPEVEIGISAFNVLGLNYYDSEFVFSSRFDRNGPPSLVPQRHVTIGPPRTLLATLALHL